MIKIMPAAYASVAVTSLLLLGCAELGIRGSRPAQPRQSAEHQEPEQWSGTTARTKHDNPRIPYGAGSSSQPPLGATDNRAEHLPSASYASDDLTIVDVDRVPNSTHFIADGRVFETTCYSLNSYDKLVFARAPRTPETRFSVVVIDDERECSATLLACTRTSVLMPSSFDEQDDSRIVLSDGTEWETLSYVYERYYSDVYICPSRGKLLLDDDVLDVIRVR